MANFVSVIRVLKDLMKIAEGNNNHFLPSLLSLLSLQHHPNLQWTLAQVPTKYWFIKFVSA